MVVRVVGLLALLGWSFAFAPSMASAEGIEVQPIALTLSSTISTGILVVANRTPTPIRFHVTAKAWRQKPDGEMVFDDTQDIVFFPSMLTLNPDESRNL